ncbi:MAG: hypothetical protein ACI97B_003326, partial [Verrucomicrobiales bacterium]
MDAFHVIEKARKSSGIGVPYDGGSVDIPTYSRESLDTLFKT